MRYPALRRFAQDCSRVRVLAIGLFFISSIMFTAASGAVDLKSFGQRVLAQALAQQIGDKAVEPYELGFLKTTGQMSAEEYQVRLQRSRAELAQLQQQVGKFSREDQGFIRQNSREIYNQKMADLRERSKQWQIQQREAQQLARQQEAEARKQQQLEAQRQLDAERQRKAEEQQQQQLEAQQQQAQLREQQAEAARQQQELLATQQAQQQATQQKPAAKRKQKNDQPSATPLPQLPQLQLEPPTTDTGSSFNWAYLWALGIVPLGAAGYFAYSRRGPRAASVAAALPAEVAPYEEWRFEEPAPAVQPASAPKVAAPPPSKSGGIKERIIAEQRAKYQAVISTAMDELTRTQLALQERANIPPLIRQDLQRLGTLIHEDARALMRAQLGSIKKPLLNALILMPLWRRFRRFGGGLKILTIIGLGWLAMQIVRAAYEGALIPVILIYALLIVPVFFFFERRAQIREPMKAFDDSAAFLKQPILLSFYRDQPSGIEPWALRIFSATDKPVFDEAQITLSAVSPTSLPGSSLLGFADIAMFRVDGNTVPSLVVAKSTSTLMSAYGSVVTEAVQRHSAELVPLIKHAEQFGELKYRERHQREDIPRLEALLTNLKRFEDLWKPVYTAEKVFEFLVRRIDLFNMRDKATPAGLLLHGYPGNGKEHLARTVAKSVSAQFVKPASSRLGTAKDVKELWTEVARGGPTVLFIEYVDQVFAKPGSEHDSPGAREATLAFLEEWAHHEPWRSRVWVVMSAQSEQNVHPRVLALLGSSKIEVAPPDTTGRELILQRACTDNELPGRPPRWLIESSGGTSVRELREIVRETKVHSVPDAPTDEHWRAAMSTVRGSEGVRDESKTWDRLVLPEEIKDKLKRAVRILREADRYIDKKVSVPNLLLFGPPGTGKTDIARTFANEGGVKFIGATTADLKAQYQGQSAHLVRDLFARARASAPCVLFIDEIESVAAKRGSPNADSYTQDIVTEMLAQMEGAQKSNRPVIVLAATNLPDQIDPAILNRFTSKIEIPLPDEAGRKELLQRLLVERPLDPQLDVEEATAFLAKRLNRKSGRDLVMLVNRAMERAVAESDSPDDVMLTRDLLLKEALPQGKEVSEADLAKIWNKIVLKPTVKDDILDKIRMFNRADKAAPKGLLLFGPPGTGKTEIARRIADSASCYFMSLKGPDLKAGYIGQSGERVQKIWEQARSRGRCVIFIDECEGVFARRGGGNADSATEELVQAFLAEWDGVGSEDQRVWVVGATNRRDLLDDAITSRFGAEVEIGLPEADERLQILRLEMEKLERTVEIPAFLGQATTGMSGRNLSRVAADVCTAANKHGGVITEDTWRDIIKRYAKSGSEAVDPNARWESLILAEETLSKLKGVCESLRHVETLRKQGVSAPKGALLYGPPGTGKTQIARTLANESGLPFIAASTADLKAGFMGQSGQKVRELFERARGRAPCILFIDEIDAVAPARGGSSSDQFTVEIVNQLLQEMDGVKQTDRHVYVLAATNRLEAVDEAVRSRLKDTIEIPNPDRAQREKLFGVFLGRLKTDFAKDVVAAELAALTNNIGGRAISAIVERASQEASNRAIAGGTPENVVITRADLLREAKPQGKEVSEADLDKIWSRIVLKPEVKTELQDKIRMFNRADKAAPKGLLLYGPPGTGKTEIARRIAESASCFFMSLTTPDLKGSFVGQTGERVKKVWEQARSRGPCVMFIDECEGVFARRGGTSGDSFSEELVQAFLAEWDGFGTEGQQVWVIGATNRRDLLDDAIVSRFGAAVQIDLPGAPERLQILQFEMEKLERSMLIPAFLGQLTTGMSGRNLARVASDVCSLAAKQGGAVTDDMWQEVVKRYTKASSEAVDEGARWESLILSEDVLDKLKTLCESLRNVEEFKAQGFDVPRGALLFGPPGTGKTQVARTLANESGLPFLAASTADLKAGYVGQAGQKVRELFERARGRAPCIVFIDEIEAVAAARGGAGADTLTGEMVNQLLQEMDGVKKSERHVFVLAATNLPASVDPAVLSRFEDQIEIPHPDLEQRERLINLFLGKLPVDFDRGTVAAELAEATEGLGGRDLRNHVQKASQKAIRRAGGNPRNAKLSREDLLSTTASPVPAPRAGTPGERPPLH